jgi:hypothetical protein
MTRRKRRRRRLRRARRKRRRMMTGTKSSRKRDLKPILRPFGRKTNLQRKDLRK